MPCGWVLLTLYVLAGAAIVPFHGDESTQIFMGRDYYHGLAEIVHDDSSRIPATERHLRLLNGTIAKTIYGWIAASSAISLDELNNQWRWDKGLRLQSRLQPHPRQRSAAQGTAGVGPSADIGSAGILPVCPDNDSSPGRLARQRTVRTASIDSAQRTAGDDGRQSPAGDDAGFAGGRLADAPASLVGLSGAGLCHRIGRRGEASQCLRGCAGLFRLF